MQKPSDRTPDNFTINPKEMAILISESPNRKVLFDEPMLGQATALELCQLLWPSVKPNEVYPRLGMSPVAWITGVLDYEASPCVSRIKKEGRYYVALQDAETKRPYYLPVWPSKENEK
jgi:hypothetical protein